MYGLDVATGGVRAPRRVFEKLAPLGELTCKQCSNRLNDDQLQVCQQGNVTNDIAQEKTRRTCTSGTFLGGLGTGCSSL